MAGDEQRAGLLLVVLGKVAEGRQAMPGLQNATTPRRAACWLQQMAPNSCGAKHAHPAVHPPCTHLSTHLPTLDSAQPLNIDRPQASWRRGISEGHRVTGHREAQPIGQTADMMWVAGLILALHSHGPGSAGSLHAPMTIRGSSWN